MGHSCVEIYIHLVFSTKDREPLIRPEMENRLYSYLTAIAKKQDVIILKVNGMADHIHMLIKLPATIALATVIKELKAYTSGWMKKSGVDNFYWQTGYGGFSYSKSLVPAVMKYIENQKEHHKTQSFKDELETLKKQWGIEWDF